MSGLRTMLEMELTTEAVVTMSQLLGIISDEKEGWCCSLVLLSRCWWGMPAATAGICCEVLLYERL